MSVSDELEAIRSKDPNGVLRPHDVVKFARNKRTELHSRFTWDDTEAAYQYRLWQAREIIRVEVSVIEQHNDPVRVYVSLPNDRLKTKGGYRRMLSVLDDAELRAELLAAAVAEFEVFRRKYGQLAELVEVFMAMDKLKFRRRKKAQ